MKRSLSIICCAALLLTLAGCNKKDTLFDGEGTSQGTVSVGEDALDSSSNKGESSAPAPSDIPLQKISELREELDRQIENVKNADYENVHALKDFTVKLPEQDVLYELEFTHPDFAFSDYYDKFDRIFDRDFGDIYSPEDKKRLYIAAADEDDFYAEDYAKIPLAERRDKFENGELKWIWLFVQTNKAYLEMYPFGNGIFRLYRDGVIKRAKPDEEPTEVIFTNPENYFKTVKDSLNVDSDERYALLDKEMSVKEAAEEVKRLVRENEYSWGGSLDPNVYQVRVIDIGEGKYGLKFMMAPSYKGVLFDVNDTFDGSNSHAGADMDKLDHHYSFSPAQAFLMESGKLETFLYGESAYTAAELAEYDSVIPLDKAVEMVSEKFGTGMSLSLGRAELLYSAMYYANGTQNNMGAFPVWKFKCYNATNNLYYIVYINAITGDLEYYVTSGWVIR